MLLTCSACRRMSQSTLALAKDTCSVAPPSSLTSAEPIPTVHRSLSRSCSRRPHPAASESCLVTSQRETAGYQSMPLLGVGQHILHLCRALSSTSSYRKQHVGPRTAVHATMVKSVTTALCRTASESTVQRESRSEILVRCTAAVKTRLVAGKGPGSFRRPDADRRRTFSASSTSKRWREAWLLINDAHPLNMQSS